MGSKTTIFLIGLLATSPILAADVEVKGPRVEVVPTPDRGVQPQAVVNASGTIHLVYLRGDPGASDVEYTSRKPGEAGFGPSIRVNSEAGTAVAVGTVRGARIATGAGTSKGANLDRWRINACPMSTVSLAEGQSDILAAWETKGQVYFSRIDRETGRRRPPTSPSGGDGDRKHPSVATNSRGETLMVWTEGTAWQKGGSLAWQVFDRAGRPLGPPGRETRAIPVWGLAAVVARPDGSFTIVR